jgi:hypothetical protein
MKNIVHIRFYIPKLGFIVPKTGILGHLPLKVPVIEVKMTLAGVFIALGAILFIAKFLNNQHSKFPFVAKGCPTGGVVLLRQQLPRRFAPPLQMKGNFEFSLKSALGTNPLLENTNRNHPTPSRHALRGSLETSQAAKTPACWVL